MGDHELSDGSGHPIVDWTLQRSSITGDLLLQLRYFTASMQDLSEASSSPVYALDRVKAIDLRDAIDAALTMDALLRRQ